MNKLNLLINNQPVKFFTASITFSIEQLAHSFNCTIVPITITKQFPVQFFLNDTLVFTGQIDSASTTTGSTQRILSISGRSLSAHLIDSRIKMNAVYNQPFDSLLKQVVKEFGLNVKNNVTSQLPIVPEFQINAESALQNLAQIAKQQNLILHEQNGVIQIERPGQFITKNVRLEDGINLEDFSIQYNFSNQFYHYEIQGAWDSAEATVTYLPANTCRKKVIIADKLQDQASCMSRAEYERDLAIAKGLSVSGKVPGLHQELTGSMINKLIEIKSKQEGFNEQLLIKTITLNVDPNNQFTTINLFRPFSEEVQA